MVESEVQNYLADNYVHAQTVDTRLSLSPPTESLGTKLERVLHYIIMSCYGPCRSVHISANEVFDVSKIGILGISCKFPET